ncbi:zinc-binding dehydrogenase [Maribellus comscasis]|nr:zinc-binding dehydrogenase [Maribellus comscasis]
MKAAVLHEAGQPLKISEIDIPKPGPGEVLIKMHASPINPSDLAFMGGGYGIQKKYPVVPGFEGSGTVVEAGKGFLPKLWNGKKVSCAASPKYNGCWAEYMVTSANMCVPVSKKINMEQASMMFVNPMTALAFFDVLKKLSNSKKEKRGIINTAAASALGRMIIKLGKKYNIPVVSVVRRQQQVEILKAEGAEFVVNSSDADFESQLKEIAHKLNTNVIFDAVGGSLVQKLLDAAPRGAHLFIYGRLDPDICEILPGNLIFSGNHIHGFWLAEYLKNKNFFHSLKTTRKIQSLIGNELSTQVNKTFPMEKISEAIEIYKNNMSSGKVLIRF